MGSFSCITTGGQEGALRFHWNSAFRLPGHRVETIYRVLMLNSEVLLLRDQSDSAGGQRAWDVIRFRGTIDVLMSCIWDAVATHSFEINPDASPFFFPKPPSEVFPEWIPVDVTPTTPHTQRPQLPLSVGFPSVEGEEKKNHDCETVVTHNTANRVR